MQCVTIFSTGGKFCPVSLLFVRSYSSRPFLISNILSPCTLTVDIELFFGSWKHMTGTLLLISRHALCRTWSLPRSLLSSFLIDCKISYGDGTLHLSSQPSPVPPHDTTNHILEQNVAYGYHTELARFNLLMFTRGGDCLDRITSL